MKTEHPFIPKIEDDHQCQIRRQFTTRTGAQQAINRIYNATGKVRTIESCRYCKGYHLGEPK